MSLGVLRVAENFHLAIRWFLLTVDGGKGCDIFMKMRLFGIPILDSMLNASIIRDGEDGMNESHSMETTMRSVRRFIKNKNCACPLANQAYSNILCDANSMIKFAKNIIFNSNTHFFTLCIFKLKKSFF